MDRKFGYRRQRGGSWIETWLSMPWAVLWLCRVTPFDRFQDKQVEIGHGYTYEIMLGYQNKKRGGETFECVSDRECSMARARG
jgi:hypothetical protein